MKILKSIIVGVISITALNSCSGDDSSSVDDVKPVIDTSVAGAAPISCGTITKGSTMNFKALFSDNVELGAYSISIHHNFDHHSHDTEFDSCDFDPVKIPVIPWSDTYTFTIPDGQQQYLAEQEIVVPADIDSGDYHFSIQLTDAQGWATMRGISIKVVD